MAVPGIPQQFFLQTGNLSNFASWNPTPTATSYKVQRSLDGVSFSTVGTPAIPQYFDTAVTAGTQYWYQILATNGSGDSAPTASQSIVPAPTAEMALGQLRLMSQQKADRVNSQFVTLPEWNNFINLAMYELYDLLITVYEDYFEAPEINFSSNGTDYIYPLPSGILTFQNQAGSTIVAPPFYKLSGVDLGINTTTNAFVTMNKYNLLDRNRYVYPNSGGTIYGVFNLRYRLMGNNIRFMPTPSAGQIIRLLYIPRLPTLMADTDLTTIGYSGWLSYVITRAAKYALDKEESDTTNLTNELMFLKARIEESAVNRDTGQPDKISDLRQGGNWGGSDPYNGFGSGGY